MVGPSAPMEWMRHWTVTDAKTVADAIKAVGAKSLIVSSDLGQTGNMIHADGLETAIAQMKKVGISDADIDLMMRKNPARLLGLND
jgi:predicted metal-dependent phosphotriesterase family hydrolase